MEDNKLYLCTVKVAGIRKPMTAYKVIAVQAANEEEAINKAWDKMGDDYTFSPRAYEITEASTGVWLDVNPYV